MTSMTALRPGVVLAVNVPQPFRRDVRVDLGGGDVGVAEHRLDGAQIRAPRQQVAGERVAQGVGGDPLLDPGRQRPAPDPVPERLAGDRLSRRERNRSFESRFPRNACREEAM